MQVIKRYDSFNFRRYGNPWVATVGANGKIDFSKKVGSYSGAYGKGEAGQLYVYEPMASQVYAYGQKDYRGSNGGYKYVQWTGAEFIDIPKDALVDVISKGESK